MGLALGISFFTLLSLLVFHELSYDSFYSKRDQIYRAIQFAEQDGMGEQSAAVPFPLGPTVLTQYPEFVESYVRLFNYQRKNHLLETEKQRYTESGFYFADANFLEVLDFPLAHGNPSEVLSEPNSLIISEEKALAYFGVTNPIGQLISYEGQFDLEIKGVFKRKKYSSHIDFDFVASMSTLMLDNAIEEKNRLNNWVWSPTWTYFVLKRGVSPEDLELKLGELVEERFTEQMRSITSIYLQPITEIHLDSRLSDEISPNGDVKYVYIFSAIAVLILVIATINFTNLSTARSSTRAKEIGVRKAIGAYRSELVVQFLVEFLLISGCAIFLGMVIVEIYLPYLSELTLSGFDFTLYGSWRPLALVALAGLAVGLISSIYPSYYLSKLRPTQALNGTLAKGVKSKMFRSILVMVQFVITVFLLVSTLVASKQWNYMTEAALGFDEESILMLPTANTELGRDFQQFKDSLLQIPHVLSVTGTEDLIGLKHQTKFYRTPDRTTYSPTMTVRSDFLKTMGISLVEGQDFGDESSASRSLLVNESFVQFQGWNSAKEAIGKQIETGEGTKEIVGVMKNFNFESLRKEVRPLVVAVQRNYIARSFFTKFVAVRIDPTKKNDVLSRIELLWGEYLPNRVFEYRSISALLEKQYEAERKLGRVSAYFSVVAIALACLGMFGLSSFTVDQRKREIAIRKSLGSSDEEVVLLLTGEFTNLVGISILIGWLVSYLIMRSWLNSFPFHTDLDLFIFLFTGTIALGITLLTVSYHTIRAAKNEPVEALMS